MSFVLEDKYRNFIGGELTEIQIEGIEFLLMRSRAILAFQTGLGKTIISLTALKMVLDKFPIARGLIICPVKAVKIFKKELHSKLGFEDWEVGVLSTQGEDFDENNNKILIVTSTCVSKYQDTIKHMGQIYKFVAIIDEAHQLQDSKSGIYSLIKEMRAFFKAIWFSTATPILNDLDSLYNMVTLLDENFFGTKTSFFNLYTISRLKTIYIKGGAKRKVRDVLGRKNESLLKKRLENICIMRQIHYNVKFTSCSKELTASEYEAYERISKGIMGEEEKSFSQRMHDLQRLVDNSYMDKYICPAHSTKEEFLLESLRHIIDRGLATLIYVDYLDTVDRLEEVLNLKKKELGINNIYKITGSVKQSVRESIEDLIDAKDIVIITSAGSESINLQRANCVLFYDIPYSVKTTIQVIGRITRVDTKHKNQYVIMMYTINTIDEYKYRLFQDYANLVQSIMGASDNLPANLADVDRKNLQLLKDKLLWHYKDIDNKGIRKKISKIKNYIIPIKSPEVIGYMGNAFYNLDPLKEIPNTTRLEHIIPDKEDFRGFVSGSTPLTVFRNRYIDKLKTLEGKQAMGMMVDGVVNKMGCIYLVDDYGIGDIVKKYILDNVKL